jgi:hypothetical protein
LVREGKGSRVAIGIKRERFGNKFASALIDPSICLSKEKPRGIGYRQLRYRNRPQDDAVVPTSAQAEARRKCPAIDILDARRLTRCR